MKYKLPFKTRFMLFIISPFRSSSTALPTARQLRQSRATVPRSFITNWFLGKMPKLQSMKDLNFAARDGVQIPVRIYRPTADQNLPLILNFHGGGWAVGNLQLNNYYCAVLASQVGAVVVSVDYRLAPEHRFPTGLHDCYDALLWAVAAGSALGIDNSRICVTGDSAGGNLSAAVSLMARDLAGPAIKFQALIYPCTDSRLQFASLETHAFAPILTKSAIFHFLEMYMAQEADRHAPYLSPMLAVSLAGLPPALVVTAGYDPLCDDGIAFASRLNAEGTAAEHLHYPEDIHGFFTLPNHTKSGREAVLVVSQRIRAVL